MSIFLYVAFYRICFIILSMKRLIIILSILISGFCFADEYDKYRDMIIDFLDNGNYVYVEDYNEYLFLTKSSIRAIHINDNCLYFYIIDEGIMQYFYNYDNYDFSLDNKNNLIIKEHNYE